MEVLIMKCKFCEKHQNVYADTTVFQSVSLKQPEWSKVIIVDDPDCSQDKEEVIFSIKYCPYCGRRL